MQCINWAMNHCKTILNPIKELKSSWAIKKNEAISINQFALMHFNIHFPVNTPFALLLPLQRGRLKEKQGPSVRGSWDRKFAAVYYLRFEWRDYSPQLLARVCLIRFVFAIGLVTLALGGRWEFTKTKKKISWSFEIMNLVVIHHHVDVL